MSGRGLFVRTEELLPVGEITEVRVTLPDGTYLGLKARVAHLLTPSTAHALGRSAGMGFELVGPDTPSRRKLRSYVEALRSEHASAGPHTPTQIVVVEPNPPLRSRMGRALEIMGFKVTSVASATECLEVCTVWRPDAIVAASNMPGMTGIDLAYAMMEHASLSDVPLVLNGDDGDLARLEAYRAGIRDYIPRPFVDEELVIRMRRIAAPQPNINPGLRGSLIDIGLGTLLSLFEFERKSGILLLLKQQEVARIFVAHGKPLKVEATTMNGTPKQRLMSLLDWRDGHFEFTPAAIGGRDELGVSVTQILLEHARVSDETASDQA